MSKPIKLILSQKQCIGDLAVLTAAIRDLHRLHPNRYITDVRVQLPVMRAIFDNNDYIKHVADYDPEVRVINCGYNMVHRSNQCGQHFITAFHETLSQELGVYLQCTEFKPDLYLTEEEMADNLGVDEPYWIVNAGSKSDFTCKQSCTPHLQEAVDHLTQRRGLRFVQIGNSGDIHPNLSGVTNMIGKTTIRQLMSLVYHAKGIICPVTSVLHFSAGIPMPDGGLRPCVVLNGGREPVAWEQYPGMTFIDFIGKLDCCTTGACWKAQIGVDCKNIEVVKGKAYPKCQVLTTPDKIINAVENYL